MVAIVSSVESVIVAVVITNNAIMLVIIASSALPRTSRCRVRSFSSQMAGTETQSAHDGVHRRPVLLLDSHNSPPDFVFDLHFPLNGLEFLHATAETEPLCLSVCDHPAVLWTSRVVEGTGASVEGIRDWVLDVGDVGAEVTEGKEGRLEELRLVFFDVFVSAVCTFCTYQVISLAVVLVDVVAGEGGSTVGFGRL